MTIGLLTEKPSAARAFAKALGGQRGTYNGEDYVIAHARGHLFELGAPETQLIGANDRAIHLSASVKSGRVETEGETWHGRRTRFRRR